MSKKIQAYTAHVQKGVLLNANESSQNLEAEIIQKIQEGMAEIAYNRYPDESDDTLLETYAKVKNLNKSQLLAGNGSDQMLGFLIGYYLGKGKTLYTWNPDFGMYDYYASSYEASVEKYVVEKDGSFDLDDFIKVGKEKNVDMILFSNPNNPTGHVLKEDEIKTILNAFSDIPVVVDEAYMEFSHHTMMYEVENYFNLYVTRTLSKAYALAAVRLGFLVTSEKNMENLRPAFVPYALSAVTQKIGTIVLSYADVFDQKIKQTIENRDTMYNILSQCTSIEFYPSAGNFIRGTCKGDKNRLLELFEQANIVIRNYENDTIRITIGNHEENEQVLKVIDQFEKENA